MYMDWAYPGHGIISRSNQKLFEAWNRAAPVDDRERARRIEAIQGNRNPFIGAKFRLIIPQRQPS
jgi:endonuclease I